MIIIYLIFYFLNLPFNQQNIGVSQDVPVFEISFYALGKATLTDSLETLVQENMVYLNREFKGQIKFVKSSIITTPYHKSLDVLYEDFVYDRGVKIQQIAETIESPGRINVYLCYAQQIPEGKQAMLGFTPILKAKQQYYAQLMPKFDRLYITYEGLQVRSTLVHEMGHFFGLSHPWEMSEIDQELMGLKTSEAIRNHMSYHPNVEKFTEEQLARMHHFALHFRNYLKYSIQPHASENK